MKVIGQRVLIRKDAPEKISEIIETPDIAIRPSQYAFVLDIGPGVEDPDLQVGDKVIVSQWAGKEIVMEHETWWLVSEDDVLCKVEDD